MPQKTVKRWLHETDEDDDFLTSPTSPGDTGNLQIPFTGSCKNQS